MRPASFPELDSSASRAASWKWRELGFLVLLAVLITPVFWLTDLDIRAATCFYDATQPGGPWWRESETWVQVFYYCPPVLVGSLVLGALIAFVLGTLRPGRKHLRINGAFLLVALILGPVVLVNAVFKNHWGRPRPKHIVEFGGTEHYRPPLLKGESGKAKSFPAGHPSVAFVFAAFFPLLRRTRPRCAWLILAGSTLLGGVMGMARMAAGGHFLSDVIWSALITWLAIWLAYYGILRLERNPGANRTEQVTTRGTGWKSGAMACGVAILITGVLIATPTHKQNRFDWPATLPAPSSLLVIAPGAQVKIVVATDSQSPGFSIQQEIQGFGLPGNRLKTVHDPAVAAATWTYRGWAKGFYTELDNTLVITIRAPLVRTLRVEVGESGRVETDANPTRLTVTTDLGAVTASP